MAEVAGLLLGGIPIAIWALKNYSEPWDTYCDYGRALGSLHAQLTIQQKMLQKTFENIGLTKQSKEELRECLRREFPDIAEELLIIVNEMEAVIANLLKNLAVDMNKKPLWTKEAPDRVTWEWRRVKRSFSSTKREKLIDTLRKWNNDLQRCLEKPEVLSGNASRKVQHLRQRFDPKKCNLIRERMKALHRALNSSIGCKCLPSHEVTVELDWVACESDTTRMVHIAMSYQDQPFQDQPSSCWRRFQVISESKTIGGPRPTAQLLVPPQEPNRSPSPTSFIWSKFPRMRLFSSTPEPNFSTPLPTPCQLPAVEHTQPEPSKIQGLCAQVTRRCDKWTLSGFLRDPESQSNTTQQFSLSHVVGSLAVSRVTRSLSLKTLIASQKLHDKDQPSLTLSAKQRYGIAAALCWSVLHLSGSPWLCEQWGRRRAKILLEKTDAGRDVLSSHPCISCHLPSEASGPEKAKIHDFSHLIPNKLVFELGILLIELCMNKPFAELKGSSSQEESPGAPLEDYSAAVKMIGDVRNTIGNGYGDAVQLCIKFVFQGTGAAKDFDHPRFRREFYEIVVAPVQATYHILSDL